MRLLGKVTRLLNQKGIDDPAKEAEILLTEALHIDRTRLYTEDIEVSPEAADLMESLAARRLTGEPLQYVVGRVDFCGLKIRVGKGVLIPRPETELLVEEVTKEIGSRQSSILDLCTGSGCIALALAKAMFQAEVYGVDMSGKALDYAVRNAEENGIKNVRFLIGDLFEPVMGMKFHCIVSNPPYIKRGDIAELQREIKDFEPVEALDGGMDGLDFYRRMFEEVPHYLHEEGLIACEIGFDQGKEVAAIAAAAELRDIRILKDYAGLDRIFIGRG